MKTLLKAFGLFVLLAFVGFSGQIRADEDTNASFQTFYDQLSDQGTWIQTDQYGYVFQPTVSDPNWRPYTYGHWVHTDAGMTWASDEPFGWATYHYGRWVNLDGTGWVWVPGNTWAPAWVSWRQSDDYCGWAPLPPETCVGVDYFDPGFSFGFGFHIGGDCDLAFGIGPSWYNFCPVAFVGDPYCYRHFAPWGNNFTIINNTRNITNININNDRHAGAFSRVHAGGPSLAQLNARSHTPIQEARLTSARTLAENGRLHGHSLSVFAPKVDPRTVKNARPQSVSQSLAKANVNRGTSINHPLAVNSQLHPASPTADQVHAATLAQGNTRTGAKVASANTQPSRPLTHSLTSLSPTAAGAKQTSSPTANATPTHQGTAPANGNSRVAGEQTATTHHTATSANANSRVAGESTATSHHTSASASSGTSFSGIPVSPRHSTATTSTNSRFTGEPAASHHAATSANAGSSFTGIPVSPRHSAASASTTSRYTGMPTTSHHATASPSTESRFTGAPVTHHSSQAGAGGYHQAPMGGGYHQSSAPAFHSSAPSPSPQSSYHSAGPSQHFGGSAPAAHYSGGNPGGGGRPSGGGGTHATSTGGQSGDKRQQH